MGWLALRRRTRQGAPESLLLWAPGVILAFAVLIPVVTLVLELTSGEDGMSGVAAILLEPDVWLLLAGSVALATAVTMLATLLAVPLGVLLGRTDVGGRGWLLAVHAFPMFVPPFLVALGWFHIVGANGYLGTPSTARLFFGPVGVVAVLGLTLAPIITSLTALALQNVDPSLEDAGRVAGGPVRVIARILLPTAWPAVALGLLLVFALALSELAVPMFLRVRTYPASVFARLGGIDYAPGEAVALGLPLDDEGHVLYPDAQIEYTDAEGRTGRVNVEVASGNYREGAIKCESSGRVPRSTPTDRPRRACSAHSAWATAAIAPPCEGWSTGTRPRSSSSPPPCNPGRSARG